MVRYAATSDLADFIGSRYPLPGDADRMLERASELVDAATNNRASGYWVDPYPDQPTVQQQAIRRAVCAQVEFWLETGEEYDIAAVPGSDVSFGASLRIGKLPDKLADRARRILLPSGLLYAGVAAIDDTWGI